jgi:hypothetical protein
MIGPTFSENLIIDLQTQVSVLSNRGQKNRTGAFHTIPQQKHSNIGTQQFKTILN